MSDIDNEFNRLTNEAATPKPSLSEPTLSLLIAMMLFPGVVGRFDALVRRLEARRPLLDLRSEDMHDLRQLTTMTTTLAEQLADALKKLEAQR